MSRNDKYVTGGFLLLILLLVFLASLLSLIKEKTSSQKSKASQFNLFINSTDLVSQFYYIDSANSVSFEYFAKPQNVLYDSKITDQVSLLSFFTKDPQVDNGNNSIKKLINDNIENFQLLNQTNYGAVSGQSTHYYYQQKKCSDIKVYNSYLNVHVSSSSQIYGLSANYIIKEPSSCVESIPQDEAIKIVDEKVKPTLKSGTTAVSKLIEKNIYNPKINGKDDDSSYLVYIIENCVNGSDCSRYFVDTQSGEIIYGIKTTIEALNRHVTSGSTVRNEGDPPTSNQNVNNLYDILGRVHNFYQTKHNRDSLNGQGEMLRGVYPASPVCVYACWTGNALYFDQGYIVDDVVAHEFTHGVSQRIVGRAGLDYPDSRFACNCDQPASLNEGLSDVFATEFDGNWTMGENSSAGVIRNAQSPKDTPRTRGGPLPDSLFSASYRCGEGSDYEHKDSTVLSHAVYLMAQGGSLNSCTITGVGKDKAYAAVYEGLKKYLVGKNSANYLDMYNAINQGCIDLNGTGATCDSIKAAMQATQMDQQPAGSSIGARCLNRTARTATCASTTPGQATPTTNPTATTTTAPTVTGSTNPTATLAPTNQPTEIKKRFTNSQISGEAVWSNVTNRYQLTISKFAAGKVPDSGYQYTGWLQKNNEYVRLGVFVVIGSTTDYQLSFTSSKNYIDFPKLLITQELVTQPTNQTSPVGGKVAESDFQAVEPTATGSPNPTASATPSATIGPTSLPPPPIARSFSGKINSLYPNTTIDGKVSVNCNNGASTLTAFVNMTGYLDIFNYTYEGRLFGVDLKKTGLLRLEMDEKTKGTAMVNSFNDKVDLCNYRGYEIVQIDNVYNKETVAFVAILEVVPDPANTTPPVEKKERINFKVKARYQGISRKPASGVEWLVARVGFDNPDLENPLFIHMPFFVDSFGVWWSYWSFYKDEFPLDLNKKYTLLIKGPKHSQKKICDNFMQESEPGAYSCDEGKIILNSDTNHLDLYGITQLAGDINQDGIINAIDIALVRNNFNTQDINKLLFLDLNIDGTVNAIDDAMVVTALKVRADQK